MPAPFTDQQLLGYLDEALAVEEMAKVEQALRGSEALRGRLAGLAARRDQGVHSVGDIWRRGRLSCPSREELGTFLVGTLERTRAEYVDFHLRTVGCRYCLANLADLGTHAPTDAGTQRRRSRFFESSAGKLRRSE
ncbi:MAG: hypothetical protein WD066_06145 [Planctomycetaceae bacterium]